MFLLLLPTECFVRVYLTQVVLAVLAQDVSLLLSLSHTLHLLQDRGELINLLLLCLVLLELLIESALHLLQSFLILRHILCDPLLLLFQLNCLFFFFLLFLLVHPLYLCIQPGQHALLFIRDVSLVLQTVGRILQVYLLARNGV